MFYLDELGFNLKYKCDNFILEYPKPENYLNFVTTYTNLKYNDISNIDNDKLETIVDFIYSKLNFRDYNNFFNTTSKMIYRINTDIRFLMIQLLSEKQYSIPDMFEWEFEKLFYIFYLEIIKDNKLKKIYYDFIAEYFDNADKQKIKNDAITMFGKIESENSNFWQEQQELINKLNNL